MQRLILASAIFLSAVSSAAFAAEPIAYSTLSARRAQIIMPAYTPAQKQLVADQAQMILRDLYVNRERKIEFYGVANDPLPAVARVVADARVLSDADLHAQLEKIFASQHDRHLAYRYPEPYACFRTVMPFSLAQATGTDGLPVVAVSALATDAGALAVDPNFAKISVGDVLLSYDGLAPLDAAKALENIANGSNPAGRLRRAFALMTFQTQQYHQLPARDFLRLSFQSRQGEVYDLEVPWVNWQVADCPAAPKNNLTGHATANKDRGVDDEQVEFERFYHPQRRSSEFEAITDTAEPTLHYDIINNEFGRFAYLRLDSFVPEVLPQKEVVATIKGLLENDLAHTDGLIFDLRSNGGGWISFGESLVQLFTPATVSPTRFRLLSSQANRDLFLSTSRWGDNFAKALGVAQTIGAPYTQPLPLATPSLLNDTGQAYFKPVAVLTNSSCYSTCDMTTASLQDHGVATIWGEDGATGGGGANNMHQSDFLEGLPAGQASPIQKLPANQDIGTAWRQAVRSGLHDGQLLEEVGVTPDRLAVPTLADFFTASGQQFRLITADLNQKGRGMQSWFKFDLGGRADLLHGTPMVFGMTASATEAVELRAKGETLGYQVVHIPASEAGMPVGVTFPGSPAAGTLGDVELIGYQAGERVWRAVKTYRIVPPATPFADGARLAWDFAGPDVAPLMVFTNVEAQADGWTVVDGKLKTGAGATYVDNTATDASLFLDLTARKAPLTVSFDLSGKTEKGFDLFKVSAISGDDTTVLLAPVSGVLADEHKVFDLTPFVGKVAELRFSFTSDGASTDEGVLLGNLVVE